MSCLVPWLHSAFSLHAKKGAMDCVPKEQTCTPQACTPQAWCIEGIVPDQADICVAMHPLDVTKPPLA